MKGRAECVKAPLRGEEPMSTALSGRGTQGHVSLARCVPRSELRRLQDGRVMGSPNWRACVESGSSQMSRRQTLRTMR